MFAYAAIEMVGVAAGEMEDAKSEVPKAVNAVIFRIAMFYCGSILLLVSMLPTSEYKSGTSPFVTVFERLGLTWISTAIQLVLIIAALSSLNSGLHSTGRVLRSLGMGKQALRSTLKMSEQGVPWAGTDDLGGLRVRALLNFLIPDAFEMALEAAAIGVLFTWSTIFSVPAEAAQAERPRGDRAEPVPDAGSPVHQLHRAGLPVLVLIGTAVSGWQASPYLSHKVTFLVVVFGIPILAVVLAIGWRAGQARGHREHRRPAQGGLVGRRTDVRIGRHSRRPRRGRARPGDCRAQPGGPELRRQLRA